MGNEDALPLVFGSTGHRRDGGGRRVAPSQRCFVEATSNKPTVYVIKAM